MFVVYAIYNADNAKLYIGQTADLAKRLASHNRKQGRHFTAQFQGEWVLIYQESVATRSEALRREQQLKSHQGRVYLTQFIPSL